MDDDKLSLEMVMRELDLLRAQIEPARTPLRFDDRDWISAPEAAQRAGVAKCTAARWCRENTIDRPHGFAQKIGGRWRVNVSRLNQFMLSTY